MYNEELKTKFIRDYTQSINTANVAPTIFNSFSLDEEGWQADLCTKSAEELQPVIDRVMALRMRSQWVAMNILKEYVRWCIANKVSDACDGMLNITMVGLDKIRKQMVSSPLHLQRCLDEVFDPEQDGTIDNIYRCYYWMAYAGIKEEDTVLVKASDVSFSEQCISFKGTSYPLYRESLPAFHQSVELTEFMHRHPNYKKPVMRPRVDGDNIMRGIRASTKLLTVRTTLSKRMKDAEDQGKSEVKLSYFRVWISGLFYRMYERERAGLPVDFSEVAADMMSGKTYRIEGVNKRIKVSHLQNRKELDYTEDYQRWKLAFSI